MRSLRRAGAVASIAIAAAVLALAACGGGDEGEEGAANTETATEAPAASGDAAKGKDLFSAQGCGSCHTLQAAGATATVGPNLDEQLASDAEKAGETLPDFTHDSIADPDAFVADGFSAGVMPSNFGDLPEDQLNDLVAFIVQSVGG
jgi:cytochrome c oxidase subunit II